MNSLVLMGEGHGEVPGLPVLVQKLLREKDPEFGLRLDYNVIRAGNASGLVKWDKDRNAHDFSKWLRFLGVAASRRNCAGVLAVFDGDSKTFPAGSNTKFCAATAAKLMAQAGRHAGAGSKFSLTVVFACIEYESWIIAGAGKQPAPDTHVLFPGVPFPDGHPESHGKTWIEKHVESYRPTRDQKPMTELLDLEIVRAKGLRSFKRLENALEQLLKAIAAQQHISSPF